MTVLPQGVSPPRLLLVARMRASVCAVRVPTRDWPSEESQVWAERSSAGSRALGPWGQHGAPWGSTGDCGYAFTTENVWVAGLREPPTALVDPGRMQEQWCAFLRVPPSSLPHPPPRPPTPLLSLPPPYSPLSLPHPPAMWAWANQHL